jgi:hypothetical protein
MTNSVDPLRAPRFESLLSRLRGQEAPEPSADFSARTVARLRQKPPSRWASPAKVLRMAAAVALLLGAGVWLVRAPVPVVKSLAPIDILMATQRADGGWSADAQNLRPRYDIGVTALALLALIHADPAALQGPQSTAIRAGVTHLISQQGADGHFGEDFSGAAFTQYLAGMALQAAAKMPNADPAWRTAAIQTEPHLPSNTQMAMLNNHLAHPMAFPSRWADAGGPVAMAAIQMLNQ